MSHFNKIATQMTDLKALVRALKRMGYTDSQIESYEEAHALYGYQGDVRSQKANVIIRRKYISGSANDVGWEKQKDGKIVSHISDYDAGIGNYKSSSATHGATWQTKLETYYNVEKAKMAFDFKHIKYTETVDKDQRIVLRACIN
jgi:hypothetical protein